MGDQREKGRGWSVEERQTWLLIPALPLTLLFLCLSLLICNRSKIISTMYYEDETVCM